MGKKEIISKGVPSHSRLFSRGIVVSNPKRLIYLSGVCSQKGGGIREQTLDVYQNITELLREAGANWDNVAKVLIFLKDISKDYEEFDKTRAQFYSESEMQKPYPTSTAVQAKLIRDDFLIEMEVTAFID